MKRSEEYWSGARALMEKKSHEQRKRLLKTFSRRGDFAEREEKQMLTSAEGITMRRKTF